MTDRVWLITGASSGLGLAFTRAALAAGDRVAAASRGVDSLDLDVLKLPLDVTDRDAVFAAVDRVVEGLSEALALEAAHFGASVTIVEPGGYWTNLYNDIEVGTENPDYDGLRAALAEQFADGSVDSDPALAAEAVMAVVTSDKPPLRIALGGTTFDLALQASEQRVTTWREWEAVSRAAEHGIPDPRGE